MKKMWNVVLAMSRPVLLGIVALVLFAGILGFRLQNLTPGLSAPEIATYESSNSIGKIIDNSVLAPYKLSIFLSTTLFKSILGLRIVGAMIGLITIALFYAFARKLLKPTIAMVATALFGTSYMFLHTARLATADVMLFSLLAMVGAGYIIRFDRHSKTAWLLATAIISLSLYVPGMVPFIFIGAIWQFRYVRRSFEELPPLIIGACSTLFSIIIAPIAINLVRSPELWRSYLGLPTVFAPVEVMAKEIAIGLASLFVYAPSDPIRWLGRQPALDIFIITMFLCGFVALIGRYKLHRLWAFLGIFIISCLWIGLTVNYRGIIIVLPFIYIIAGMGIERLLDQWLDVFPRNPIARWTGSILMLAAVLLSVNFQLQRYFVAWPHNLETKQVFTSRFPDTRP
jgi:hypothetical protein